MSTDMSAVQPFVAVLKDDPEQKQVPVLAIDSTDEATYFLLASCHGQKKVQFSITAEKASYISSWHWVKDTEVAHLWPGPAVRGSLAREESLD